ncbi:hypothetical protein ABPG77_008524 [Micractinium sp. CCAP 211/92]
MALRQARSLPLRQLALLSHAGGALPVCLEVAAAAAAGGGSAACLPCLPAAPAATLLWRLDSPLLRHLSSSAAVAASQAAEAAAAAAVPALPQYEQLQARAAAGSEPLALRPKEQTRFDALLRNFQLSGSVKDQALALYVNSKLYAEAVPKFREFLLAAMDSDLRAALLQLQPGEASQEALFPYFAQFVLERYMEDIKAYRDVVATVDLRKPHTWFPVARALQRRIIYHAGPTNSGKTYNALQAMRAAKSGVYCGPLRLLAMEVYDTCNAEGLYCNLITGQERREVPGAAHTACTVEMVNMQRRVDVAVIDEIQMIGDESRGWAWTRALMGVPANEVHLCGDGSAVPLVRRICEDMGEHFEVANYDRFTALSLEDEGLVGGYQSVQPGDCIVAFSRRDIYDIKQLIEQETKHRCCVVYGALPPETRRQQAKLFNEPDNAYRVLVASDAVGMGLNLNIRRIIFHTMAKREGGRKTVPVSVSMVKQIAGRAGRRSSQWPHGLATCRDPADVPRLQEALEVPLGQLTTPSAGLFPEFEHFEVFAGARPDAQYSDLLAAFEQEALLDSSYFFCRQDSVRAAAQLLGKLPLSVKDMFTFCMAPASATDLRLGAALLHFATKYSKGLPVPLDISVPDRVPRSTDELRHMEAAHQVVMLWLWLSYRFDQDTFPQREKVQALADRICLLLDKGLRRITRLSKSGVDVAEQPVRPELDRMFDSFSEELAELEAQRQAQLAAERGAKRAARREAREAARQARLAERLELAEGKLQERPAGEARGQAATEEGQQDARAGTAEVPAADAAPGSGEASGQSAAKAQRRKKRHKKEERQEEEQAEQPELVASKDQQEAHRPEQQRRRQRRRQQRNQQQAAKHPQQNQQEQQEEQQQAQPEAAEQQWERAPDSVRQEALAGQQAQQQRQRRQRSQREGPHVRRKEERQQQHVSDRPLAGGADEGRRRRSSSDAGVNGHVGSVAAGTADAATASTGGELTEGVTGWRRLIKTVFSRL